MTVTSFFVLKIIFNVNPDNCCMVIIWIVIKYYVVTSGQDFILLLKFIASFTNVVVYKTNTTKQDKMEMERQYYLEYPFNQEFDHLPVRYFTFLVFHNTGIVLHCIALHLTWLKIYLEILLDNFRKHLVEHLALLKITMKKYRLPQLQHHIFVCTGRKKFR